MRQVSCLDEDFRAGIAGGCVAVLSAESCREGEMNAVAGAGQGCVWVCTDVRACREGQSPVLAASGGGHISCVEALLLAKAGVLKCDK